MNQHVSVSQRTTHGHPSARAHASREGEAAAARCVTIGRLPSTSRPTARSARHAIAQHAASPSSKHASTERSKSVASATSERGSAGGGASRGLFLLRRACSAAISDRTAAATRDAADEEEAMQ